MIVFYLTSTYVQKRVGRNVIKTASFVEKMFGRSITAMAFRGFYRYTNFNVNYGIYKT